MRLIKQVVEIGNGAAVYVPKEYKGKEIVIILPEGIEEIKQRVLTKLIKFMPNVLGVYLYGSYSRGEETPNSDIDLLIVVKEMNKQIKQLFPDLDVRVITLESIKNSIKNFPGLIIPILKEAQAFMNPLLLEELNKEKINFKRFKWNFQDIRRIINIIETFLEIDDKNIPPSHIYSLIMRIRVLYMIESIIKNKEFSNQAAKNILQKYGLTEKTFEKYCEIYQKIRDNEEVKEKINKEEILRLILILKNYLAKVENEAKKEA